MNAYSYVEREHVDRMVDGSNDGRWWNRVDAFLLWEKDVRQGSSAAQLRLHRRHRRRRDRSVPSRKIYRSVEEQRRSRNLLVCYLKFDFVNELLLCRDRESDDRPTRRSVFDNLAMAAEHKLDTSKPNREKSRPTDFLHTTSCFVKLSVEMVECCSEQCFKRLRGTNPNWAQ